MDKKDLPLCSEFMKNGLLVLPPGQSCISEVGVIPISSSLTQTFFTFSEKGEKIGKCKITQGINYSKEKTMKNDNLTQKEDDKIIGYVHTIPVLKDLAIKKLKDAIGLISNDQSIILAAQYCSYAKTYLNCIIERENK